MLNFIKKENCVLRSQLQLGQLIFFTRIQEGMTKLQQGTRYLSVNLFPRSIQRIFL